MQACGGCSVQDVSQVVQLLANPALWVVALAALSSVWGGKKTGSEKKDK
jgi:hypothetical protein